jgi:hypothetical protein
MVLKGMIECKANCIKLELEWMEECISMVTTLRKEKRGEFVFFLTYSISEIFYRHPAFANSKKFSANGLPAAFGIYFTQFVLVASRASSAY